MSPERASSFPRAALPWVWVYPYTRIFLPDIASARYARETTALLENAGVVFVPRDENPPWELQLCPIEAYWSDIKQGEIIGSGRRSNGSLGCVVHPAA